jgi:hypothetical protein
MRLMGTGKRRINSVVRALEIAPAAELGTDQVVAREPAIVPVEELALAIVPVAEVRVLQEVAGLAIAQEVAELGTDPVVAREPAIVPVEELALAIDQVVVVPELGLLPDQLARVLKTKSVTAAHRRDLPLLAAEDLAAAAAGTTREPAATEAGEAWEAADLVVVVAVAGEVEVEAVAVAAAADVDETSSVRKHK